MKLREMFWEGLKVLTKKAKTKHPILYLDSGDGGILPYSQLSFYA